MMPVYEKLLKASPPLKMLIYSGDDDAVWGVSTHTDFEGSRHAWAWAHSSRRHGTS